MNNFPDYKSALDAEPKSYADILGDISKSSKVIVLNDLKLAAEELKTLGRETGKQTRNLAIWGYIALLSFIPLMLFLIIGLGEILDGRYWLSAFIIGAVMCMGGILGGIIAVNKIKKINFNFTKTSSALKREGEVIYRQFNKLQNALKKDEESHAAY